MSDEKEAGLELRGLIGAAAQKGLQSSGFESSLPSLETENENEKILKIISENQKTIDLLKAQLEESKKTINLHLEKESDLKQEALKVERDIAQVLTEQKVVSEYEKSINEQEKFLNIQKTELHESQKKSLIDQQELLSEKKQIDIDKNKIKQERSDLENQTEIADSAKEYMEKEISIRIERRNSYQLISHIWTLFAAFLIILGLGLFYDQYGLLEVNLIVEKAIPISTATFLLLKGGFFITAFGVAIRFCMAFRDSFMKEATKEDERLHVMSYGKFYIDTYAATSTREQVTEALSSWTSKTEEKTEGTEVEIPSTKDLLDLTKHLKEFKELLKDNDNKGKEG